MLRFSVSSGCVWLLWPSTASAGSAKLCMAFLTETGTLRCLTCCSAPWEMCWQRSFTGARGRKIIWPTLSSPCKGKHTALYDSLNNTEKTFTTLCDCDRVHTHTHTHTYTAQCLSVFLLQETWHSRPEDGRLCSVMSYQTRPGGCWWARRLLHSEGCQRWQVPGGFVPRWESYATLHHTHRQRGGRVSEGPTTQRNHHRGKTTSCLSCVSLVLKWDFLINSSWILIISHSFTKLTVIDGLQTSSVVAALISVFVWNLQSCPLSSSSAG